MGSEMCIRDRPHTPIPTARGLTGSKFEDWLVKKLGGTGNFKSGSPSHTKPREFDGAYDDVWYEAKSCLLYTSDAADERSSVDLGGRRIIKKKKI